MPKIDTTVGNLVEMIKNGELSLPEMQRRYVWPETRVRDLLDSLYRGYPSGTILVWETDQEMPIQPVAVSQGANPFKGHKMLLDGQQRLTSLSAILRGVPVRVSGKDKPIEILFNLDHPDGPPAEVIEVDGDSANPDDEATPDEDGPNLVSWLKNRTFVVASQALLTDPHWVLVSDIFSGKRTDAQILKPLVASFDDPLFEKYSKRLQDVRKIKDYQYVMHVLDKELSYVEVAEIFVRVNSLGMKLRGSDLALAQITSRWQGALQLFEKFQEECEEKWFTLDLGLLVRALVVFATGQSRFKTVGNIPLQRLKEGWTKAIEGLRFSVNFLLANAGIEDESLLSSPLLIIVPGFYAAKRNYQLSPEDERGLKQWLYVANARGHFSGSSETTLDADLSIISKGGTTADLINVLKLEFGRLEITAEDFVGRNKQNALFATAYLALKARGAKDWRTGLGLSLTHQGSVHIIEHHHIHPKARLRQAGFNTAEINEIANLAFIAGGTNRKLSKKPAEEYLAEMLQSKGTDALVAHCIPLDQSLWKLEAYPKFLEYRRTALAQAINEFIESGGASKSESSLQSALKNIDAVVGAGEGAAMEFKSSARWDYREQKHNKALEIVVAKTLAGFLNAEGGLLVLGVDNSGKTVGLEQDFKTLTKYPDKDGYEQFLVNLVAKTLGKVAASFVKIGFCTRDAKEVCVVHAESSHQPVWVDDQPQPHFYLRSGNTTQELSGQDQADYIKVRFK
ncbi:MAG TPA: DUF262 domain-containing protein [Verrucomicrobiae bacterium]|nr:DUF262 domain-containing protein [Verrucomicrobiae bacterium]